MLFWQQLPRLRFKKEIWPIAHHADTATLPRSDPALTTGTNIAALRRPWWIIPEVGHM